MLCKPRHDVEHPPGWAELAWFFWAEIPFRIVCIPFDDPLLAAFNSHGNSFSGASNSDVGYNSSEPTPSDEEPLGVKYPGETWSEPGSPNWVGIAQIRLQLTLIRTAWPRMKSISGQVGFIAKEFNGSPLLVFDYAVGGHVVDPGVVSQIRRQFLPGAGGRPDWAKWAPNDSLFSKAPNESLLAVSQPLCFAA